MKRVRMRRRLSVLVHQYEGPPKIRYIKERRVGLSLRECDWSHFRPMTSLSFLDCFRIRAQASKK
jgi:hypothetical protein